jgi:hypothetical protein
MTNRRTLTISMFAFAVLALCLPALASAQGVYDPWGRNRDDDYRRNRNYGRYDERYLKDSIQRLDRVSKDFERDLDRALDRSRVDGTRREDELNNRAHDFRRAVGDLKSRFGNGRDLNRSRNEAQRVLSLAQQLDRVGVMRRTSDGRIASEWSQIRNELGIISDAYNLGYYGGWNNGGWNNGRNRNNNNDWWRRIPFPN